MSPSSPRPRSEDDPGVPLEGFPGEGPWFLEAHWGQSLPLPLPQWLGRGTPFGAGSLLFTPSLLTHWTSYPSHFPTEGLPPEDTPQPAEGQPARQCYMGRGCGRAWDTVCPWYPAQCLAHSRRSITIELMNKRMTKCVWGQSPLQNLWGLTDTQVGTLPFNF